MAKRKSTHHFARMGVNGCGDAVPYAEKPINDENVRDNHSTKTTASCKKAVCNCGVSHARSRSIILE